MQEYYRTGKGDDYIEVSADWGAVDHTRIIWWLQEMIAGDNYSNKKFKKALLEVADSIVLRDEE